LALSNLLQNLGSDLSNDLRLELLKEQENLFHTLNEKKRKLTIKDNIIKLKKQRSELEQQLVKVQKEILCLEEKPVDNILNRKLEEILEEKLKETEVIKEKCTICQEEIPEKFTKLSCSCMFCTPCIKSWIDSVLFQWSKSHDSLQKCKVSCPNCKRFESIRSIKKIIPECFEVEIPNETKDATKFDYWLMMQDLVKIIHKSSSEEDNE